MISPDHPPILVIEDDDALRQTLSDILELNGFDSRTAANGAEGLSMALAETPSLVITDIEMPGMNGFELLRRFQQDEQLRSIPVIVISAKVDRQAIRQGMELGADDFITKPFTEDEVIHSMRKRLEKKELLEELDAFAHTVAHDLNNPLAVLMGRLELLEMNLAGAEAASMGRQVAEARASASRLEAIIEELLVLAGVRKQNVVARPLDMDSVVSEAMQRIEYLLRTRGATVAKPPLWPAALGFEPWVAHIWSNYISNAAIHSGPKPRITLGADEPAGGGPIRFWVRDEGTGLDTEAQSKLFVPFTRISSIRLKGHGLGLSIVRRIVEKLGGRAGVDSRPGHGSRFWFELPPAPPPGKAPDPPSHP